MSTIEKKIQIKQVVKRGNQLINPFIIHIDDINKKSKNQLNRETKPSSSISKRIDRFQIENRKTNLLRWKKLEDGLRCLNRVDLRSFEIRPREGQEEEIDKGGTDRKREDELIQISITDPPSEKSLSKRAFATTKIK